VARFLNGALPFLGIAALIESALAAHTAHALPTLDDVLAPDTWSREFARGYAAWRL